MRLADPHAELPIKNFKYIKNCTEMYLAKRRIERLAHFESFVNLEALWINDNEIVALDGLDTCVRIKRLYAQNNRIRSLTRFTFLKELRLYDNKLKDLHGTLAILSELRHLEDLDLFGNPLQEEENYRLQVIRTVPSLFVLDRHVITNEERAKAERFRPVSHDPSTLRGATGSTSIRTGGSGSKKSKNTKKSAVVAGAPPQEMSGTVKMLFREVAAIQREQKVKEREAAERELLELSNTHKVLLASSSSTSKPKRASVVENLDDWDLAVLRKRFHLKEAAKNSGVARDDVSKLLEYLVSRGYKLSVNGQDFPYHHATRPGSASADASTFVKRLFPSIDKVSWADLLQCLESRRLACDAMAAKELNQRAAWCFAKSTEFQSRLQSLAATDPKRQELTKECLELSQQAYHLQALTEKLDRPASAASIGESRAASRKSAPLTTSASVSGSINSSSSAGLAAPVTKYFITAYSRDVASAPASLASLSSTSFASSTCHGLKEQPTQADAALAAKYRLQHKDYIKYVLKHGAAPAKLIKRNVQL